MCINFCWQQICTVCHVSHIWHIAGSFCKIVLPKGHPFPRLWGCFRLRRIACGLDEKRWTQARKLGHSVLNAALEVACSRVGYCTVVSQMNASCCSQFWWNYTWWWMTGWNYSWLEMLWVIWLMYADFGDNICVGVQGSGKLKHSG